MNAAHQKVAASHLSRDAYLYVRQSTQRQVFDHGESTRRQYALRERAVALGWPTESIVVIDSDLGLSGADTDREGFQHLVAEVGMGRAGIVLGLEVSRLARNSTDWHRLLEICALSDETIYRWRKAGLLHGHAYNDRPEYLFEIPDPPPNKQPGRSPKQGRFPDLVGQRSIEAQYET